MASSEQEGATFTVPSMRTNPVLGISLRRLLEPEPVGGRLQVLNSIREVLGSGSVSNRGRWGHLLEPAEEALLEFPMASHTRPPTPLRDFGLDRRNRGSAPWAGPVRPRFHELETVWMGGEEGTQAAPLVLADGEPYILPNDGVVPLLGNSFQADCAHARHAAETDEGPQNRCAGPCATRFAARKPSAGQRARPRRPA